MIVCFDTFRMPKCDNYKKAFATNNFYCGECRCGAPRCEGLQVAGGNLCRGHLGKCAKTDCQGAVTPGPGRRLCSSCQAAPRPAAPRPSAPRTPTASEASAAG